MVFFELKNVIGGYDLPEVVITCGQYQGKCRKCVLEGNPWWQPIFFEFGHCEWTGKMSDYCAPI